MSEYNAMTQLAKSAPEAKRELQQKESTQRIEAILAARREASEIFWRGVMRFITHMTLAIIVVYTLFHFL